MDANCKLTRQRHKLDFIYRSPSFRKLLNGILIEYTQLQAITKVIKVIMELKALSGKKEIV